MNLHLLRCFAGSTTWFLSNLQNSSSKMAWNHFTLELHDSFASFWWWDRFERTPTMFDRWSLPLLDLFLVCPMDLDIRIWLENESSTSHWSHDRHGCAPLSSCRSVDSNSCPWFCSWLTSWLTSTNALFATNFSQTNVNWKWFCIHRIKSNSRRTKLRTLFIWHFVFKQWCYLVQNKMLLTQIYWCNVYTGTSSNNKRECIDEGSTNWLKWMGLHSY